MRRSSGPAAAWASHRQAWQGLAMPRVGHMGLTDTKELRMTPLYRVMTFIPKQPHHVPVQHVVLKLSRRRADSFDSQRFQQSKKIFLLKICALHVGSVLGCRIRVLAPTTFKIIISSIYRIRSRSLKLRTTCGLDTLVADAPQHFVQGLSCAVVHILRTCSIIAI